MLTLIHFDILANSLAQYDKRRDGGFGGNNSNNHKGFVATFSGSYFPTCS